MAVTANLHIVDYVIFVAVLVFSIGIGLYYAFTGDKQRTTKEYLMADRKLAVIPVALSMFMSYFSAIYILGQTAETYQYGLQTWMSMIGICGGYILICQIFIPIFYPLKLTSAFEWVDRRYKSRPLRVAIAICMMIAQTVYMGVAMYAPGTALEAVTGFPLWASIVITGCVVTFYTTLGGMKAVVWTDVFQGVVMMVGLLVVLIMGSLKVGGLGKAWRIANEAGRVNFLNFDPDPTNRMTFWPLVFGTLFNIIAGVGTAQAYVQRYCALPTMRAAKQAMLWQMVLYVLLSVLLIHIGLVVFAYYHELGCDPLRSGQITNANQLLPYFVLNGLNIPGLTGLFISVLYSGALSSLSSVLSSLSAVTWKDILEHYLIHLEERRKALITKIIVFIFGCIGVGFAFLVNILSGHVVVISIRLGGSLSSPIKGIMLVGSVFPGVEWVGAIVGSVVSLVITNWMNIGAYLTRPHRQYLYTIVSNCTFLGNTTAKPMPVDPPNVFWLYRVSFLWISVIGTVLCIGVAMLVSKFRKKDKVDPRLMLPICDQIFCCLPTSIRKFFYCGVDFDSVKEEKHTEMEIQKLRPMEDVNGKVNGEWRGVKMMNGVGVNEGYHKIPLVKPLTGQAAGIYDIPNGNIHTIYTGKSEHNI